jgi:hypothetical protein
MAGRSETAVQHLRRALELEPALRELVAGDPDLDPVRALLGSGD